MKTMRKGAIVKYCGSRKEVDIYAEYKSIRNVE